MSFGRGFAIVTGGLTAWLLFPVLVLGVVCGGLILAAVFTGNMAHDGTIERRPPAVVAPVPTPIPSAIGDPERLRRLDVAGAACTDAGGVWSVPGWAVDGTNPNAYNALWCAGPPVAHAAASAAWRQW